MDIVPVVTERRVDGKGDVYCRYGQRRVNGVCGKEGRQEENDAQQDAIHLYHAYACMEYEKKDKNHKVLFLLPCFVEKVFMLRSKDRVVKRRA